ncbi:hypothetical protein LUZ60_016305 [Juncus effusus]|nr:hypothetical protein LUZ60_016305 [Juncus effusus]
MASQESFFKTLKQAFSSFRATTQKLAAQFTSQFEHSSEPCLIDEADLDKLKSKLDRVRSALQSADDLSVPDLFDQHWMKELRDLQHRAEDLLEEIEFASVRAARLEEFNFELSESKDSKRKRQEVCLLFSSFPSDCFDLKIDRIMDRYEEIASDRLDLQLCEEDGLRCGSALKQISTTSLTTGELFGREKDFVTISNFLLSDNRFDQSVGVISVTGMPGVGKTALVQHLYHDPKVQNHFDYCIWICASCDFDAKKITRIIIQSYGGDTRDLDEFSLLQNELLVHTLDKRLLLVVDDFWVGNKTEDFVRAKANWESLQTTLSRAGKQNKVVFTCQNVNVNKIIGSNEVHNVSCLSDEVCWLICKKKALNSRKPSESSFLTRIGQEIVKKKCKGLPLAAKVIGDFLHLAANEENWLKVLHGELGSNDELLNEILSSLKVGYDRLSSHLKRCFAYCSLFPKGYEFEEEKLVRIWIGQGFVEPHRSLKPQEIGGQYFEELVGRFLFQKLPNVHDCVEKYVMHDLFHELVQSIAHEECCRIEGYKLCDLHEKARHSSLVPPCLDLEKAIECDLLNEKDLQTFLFIGKLECKFENKLFHMNMHSNVFSHMKCLRALDLSYTDIKELPSSINHLTHLRYLVLTKINLQRLPESICGLFKLQTLDLKHCEFLNEIPWGIKHLFSLKHLELPKPNNSSVYIPPGIGQLITLTKLPVFFVASDSEGCRIEELRDLVNLENELHILGLHNVNEEEAKRAKLVNKAKLQKLTLEWSSLASSSNKVSLESSCLVLEELKPHENLNELEIIGYKGSKFPNWIGDLPHLHTLTIRQCNNLKNIPKLNSARVLNVQCCEQLCPIISFPLGYQLPLSLESVQIGAGCPLLSQWIPHNFKEDASFDKECRKLIRKKQGSIDPECSLPVHSNLNFVEEKMSQLSETEVMSECSYLVP